MSRDPDAGPPGPAATGSAQAPPRRGGRALVAACGGMVAAAGLLWAASATVWYRVGSTGVDGGAAHPGLTAVALLALAGIAALVALSGVWRRTVAVLLALVAAWITGTAALGLAGPPADVVGRGPGALPATGAVVTTPAPLLGVAGGVLLLAVAVAVLVREPRLPRPGARYGTRADSGPAADPDRAAWTALDEGRDPTADPKSTGGAAQG